MKPITFPTKTSMHPEQCPLKPSYAIITHVSDGTKIVLISSILFWGDEIEVQLQGTHSPE